MKVLYLRGLYCLKINDITPVILIVLLNILFLNGHILAQTKHTTPIQPLKIGDSIPEAVWNLPLQVVNHPEGKDTITLNDYRNNKLIILDFWATSCSPCVKSLDKLDTLRQLHKVNLAILPILVYDLERNALPFMIKKKWKWPSVVNNTFLNKILFSRYITGFGNVWIVDGKLFAIPRPDNITEKNILNVLNERKVALQNLVQQFN